MKKTIIKNITLIAMLDLISTPVAIYVYLAHGGFHIVHIFIGLMYMFGLGLVYDTVKMIGDSLVFVEPVEEDYSSEEEAEEDLKPEMKSAMDKVFGLKK